MNTGETVYGGKMHAVSAEARDGSWMKALCGAEVFVHVVEFSKSYDWSRCSRCNKLAQKSSS
jgi:hypothetical protein